MNMRRGGSLPPLSLFNLPLPFYLFFPCFFVFLGVFQPYVATQPFSFALQGHLPPISFVRSIMCQHLPVPIISSTSFAVVFYGCVFCFVVLNKSFFLLRGE
jgi:hypothetical protein